MVLHKTNTTTYLQRTRHCDSFHPILQIGVAIVLSEILATFATFASSPHNFDIVKNFKKFETVPLRVRIFINIYRHGI